MFCIMCGSREETVENLCPDCYLKTVKPLSISPSFEIRLCSTCLSWKKHADWDYYRVLDDLVDQRVLSDLGVNIHIKIDDIETSHKIMDKHRRNIDITVKGTILNNQTVCNASTIVFLKKELCPRCSKIAGGYFESILQLRTEAKTIPPNIIEEVKKYVEKSISEQGKQDRTSFISKITEVKGGVDFFFSRISDSKRIAGTLSGKYGCKVKESSSLIGQQDGKDIKRVTFLLRLPSFNKGDFVVLNESLWKVGKVSNKVCQFISLESGEILKKRRENIKKITTIGGPELVENAIIISRSRGEKEIKLMQPHTFEVQDIIIPAVTKISNERREVKVIIWKDKMYLAE